MGSQMILQVTTTKWPAVSNGGHALIALRYDSVGVPILYDGHRDILVTDCTKPFCAFCTR